MLSLDTHAHVVPHISLSQLEELQACVVAVTRSLEEFESVTDRTDPTTAWGLGCHPGLAKAQRAFSAEHFSKLLEAATVVGEVGLDGSSRVPMEKQREVFRSILAETQRAPRIITVHSYRATKEVLEELQAYGGLGVILHWWLGRPSETRVALELGCFFSVNASSVGRDDILSLIPTDRILTETDHPFGDRRSREPRRPGAMEDVETKLAARYGLTPTATRLEMWRNFGRLVRQSDVEMRLPESFRSHIESATDRKHGN